LVAKQQAPENLHDSPSLLANRELAFLEARGEFGVGTRPFVSTQRAVYVADQLRVQRARVAAL
jgi:hypothetical protein